MSRVSSFCLALTRMRRETLAQVDAAEKARQLRLPSHFVAQLIAEEISRRRK